MDTLVGEFSGSMDGFKSNHDLVRMHSNQRLVKGFDNRNHRSTHNNFMNLPYHPHDPQVSSSLGPLLGSSLERDSPEESDYSDAVLKYINQILMEEDLEGKTCMFQDCFALQAFEKSFYDALGEKYPPSLHQPPSCVNRNVKSPDDDPSSHCSSTTTKNLAISSWVHGLGESGSSELQISLVRNFFLSTAQPDSHSSSGGDSLDGLADSPVSTLMVPNSLGRNQSVGQFRDIEEAHKFLMSDDDLSFNLENKRSILLEPNKSTLKTVTVAEEEGNHYLLNGSRGRKNHFREDSDDLEEGRSNKHSAIYAEETEQSELFDEVLLCRDASDEPALCVSNGASGHGASRKFQQSEQLNGSNGRTKRGKGQGNKGELVDLTTVLVHCAQAVASNDLRTARELLKQIRQHSSPFGDGSQRLAHCFANGLEARLAGHVGQLHTAFAALNRTSASDILKAYHVFISACPFKKMSNMFANQTIVNLAEKATRLHIIDFGILYGFQWPCLIQRLSARPGGPPKLRITGIELPQPGFRPAERVEETGRRLADYCARFHVPFEYNAIAKKWETIELEEFKIDKDELLVVNCLYRFRNLLDETVVANNNPRDAVLSMIRRINPDLFIHGVVNGTYNAPFFTTRFREALFHFSALFDMFEACVPREDEARMMYETEIYGRDAMNVIACEGSERVERPESYKQWLVRNLRAGFRQLPLNRDILRRVKSKVISGYHRDFVVDEDSQWMLQGWKGRIIFALSCWRTA
ncbi:scarecrow-like protein 33 isoform X2 [Malania oleifera]|nr:scarecrow-like protein 33 isoform X2 [Malania oleifera]XP_057953724.1 scarecrow-like protein 33 isoform X2 [Malania oleifera]XP_057953725.1 scarecrow-like protein 33 isoform X2 [Malania oleifera]XP_057953726.1 scarecrow-like protein 33 isoform X2 [Malania oleifera]